MCSRYTVCAASVQRMFLSFDKRAQINLRRLNLPVQLKSPARPPNLQSALGNQPCIRSFSKKKGTDVLAYQLHVGHFRLQSVFFRKIC